MKSLWPIFAAVVIVAAAGFARRSPAPAPRENPAPATADPVHRVVVGEPSAPARAERAPEPAAPAIAEADLPSPPAEAVERTESLQDWLVSMPAPDLARLAGTAKMDAYVSRVVGHLQATAKAGPDGLQELDLFLRRLNGAILQAKGTLERR